jgi:hypothetical protein
MEEDYIVQDDSSGTGGSNNRPFLTAAGLLLLVFILAAGCGAYNLISRGANGQTVAANPTAEAIFTQNAIVAVTNEAVTLTIRAMETEAARPTETPTLPPTATQPSPATETPEAPTLTPVVPEGEGIGEDGEEGEDAPPAEGTTTFVPGDDSTPTPIPVATGNDKGALPDTGIETWSAMLLALALVAVLFIARRLRSA